MIELDFLWVGEKSKTGDAILARFTYPGSDRPAIIVVDGGTTEVGDRIVEHVRTRFGAEHVDAVISTHPDNDHICGLTAVVSELSIGCLLVHQPAQHGHTSDEVKAEQVDELVDLASGRGIRIIEPFAGVHGFGHALTVVGPTTDYYLELLDEEERFESRTYAVGKALESAGRYAMRTLKSLKSAPQESLIDDSGGTSPRNNTSVILNLAVDGRRVLLTGDAGVPALNLAADFMTDQGLDDRYPDFFQIPHHGSRHNLDPKILDRLLGKAGDRPEDGASAIATVGREAVEHPRPEIANAVHRRGHTVFDTRGQSFWWHKGNVPGRDDYTTATPLPWFDESE